jgi:hypothetical protein
MGYYHTDKVFDRELFEGEIIERADEGKSVDPPPSLYNSSIS